MMNIMQALRCKRTARRLSKYVDMDPSALLSDREIAQVRKHLAECDKCTSNVEDLNRIKANLQRMGASRIQDESSLTRLKTVLDELLQREE